MTTKTNLRKTVNKQSSLKRRIRQFYDLLNQREFARCYQMIDPRVREKSSSVTLLQYENALAEFLGNYGSVEIAEITIDLHLDEPSKLYEGRDFALGKTAWTDEQGTTHFFSERWVFEGRSWFTRSTGFVVPLLAESARLGDMPTLSAKSSKA